jgi:hypothetical protein
MEFVEKHLEALKKITNRGGQSLEVKQKKEEEIIVQKVLKLLQEERDVRKGDWNNKEVIDPPQPHHSFCRPCVRACCSRICFFEHVCVQLRSYFGFYDDKES